MADVLIYWRDYAANRATSASVNSDPQGDDSRNSHTRGIHLWHSSAKCVAELQPGDRMWMVTSGKGLREDAEQAAFLVGVWAVREVIGNPNDDSAYPAEDYRKRVTTDPSASVMLTDPINVDHILRPVGSDQVVSIGRFLRGPRVLSDEKKRLLRAAAGGELASAWLRGKPSYARLEG